MSPLQDALRALHAEELVLFPTETVLGLGGDARSPTALRRLVQAKGRPDGKPFTVHLGPSVDPTRWAIWDARARALAEAFWPGPLTLVLPLACEAHPLLTGGGDTIGLRIPAHPAAIALLDAFQHGVAASSANQNGQPVATTIRQAQTALGHRVSAFLEGNPAPNSRGSTVLNLVGVPRILRVGDLDPRDLQAHLPDLVIS